MLLALLLSLSLAAPAVTGVVRDSSGGAISGATVTIQTPAGAEQQQTVTGPDGRFSFEAAPSGDGSPVVKIPPTGIGCRSHRTPRSKSC